MCSGKCGKIIVGPKLSELSACEGIKANIRKQCGVKHEQPMLFQ